MARKAQRWRVCTRLLVAGVLAAATAVGGTSWTATAAGDDGPVGASTETPTTTLFPGQLERGADTPLLHMEEEVIVDGDLRIPVDGPEHMWLMGRFGRHYLVTVAGADFERYSVLLVRRNGEQRVVRRFGGRTAVTMSADGRHLAMATAVRPDTRIRIFRTRTGEVVRERTFASYGAEVSDYGTRRLVLVGIRGGRTFWWDPVRDRLRLLAPGPARADIEADRLVVLHWAQSAPYIDCQSTVRLSRPSEVLWRSCRDIPLTFSPEAGRMVTTDIQSDGIGPWELRIRGPRGRVLHTYRAPMWFGFVGWESDTEVLLQPVGRHHLAAVRCDLRGECERASRLYEAPGTFDPPETMRWSFPQ